MKKLLLCLSMFAFLASGCASTYPNGRRYPDRYPDRNRPVYDGRRADPVVGRTRDGRRIYEDRQGRVYTMDRYGRKVYENRRVYDRRTARPRVTTVRHVHYDGCEHDDRYRKNNGNGRGKKKGHYKNGKWRDRDDD